jgi:molybdate transport system substrate-binding protein
VRLLLAVLALTLAGCSATTERPDFIVAAAADLRFAMDDIGKRFQLLHPEVTVKVIYGSSGQFYQQIENGAPYDVYCSADLEYPRKLTQNGLAIPGTEFQYAVGRIVVWVSNTSNLTGEVSLQSLRDPSVKFISIANPGHAPYGKAAVSALTSLGVYESVKSKLVFGENVSQALQYIQTGSADIGIIALSLALAPSVKDTGRYWELPLDSYPRMDQGGVILKSSKNETVARAFRSFVLGDTGRTTLKNYGFFMPLEQATK